ADLRQRAARPQGAKCIEFRRLARFFGDTVTNVIAFIEQFRLLQLLKAFLKCGLRVIELRCEFVDRSRQVLAASDGSLRISRIGEMGRVMYAGPLLLDHNLALKISCDAPEVCDHRLDLGNLATLLVKLKFFQADERVTRLHEPYSRPPTNQLHPI